MKIIMATNICRDLYYSKKLISSLVEAGMDVTVFANPDETTPLMEKLCRFEPVEFVPRGKSPFTEFKLLRRFKAFYKKERPDCVLHFNAKPVIYGGLAAASLKIPALTNMTGLGTVYLKPSMLQNLLTVLYRRVLKAPRAFTFFANPDNRALFLQKNIVTEVQSTVVPGTGVDTEYYKAQSPLDFSSTDVVRFAFAGRLLRSKGLVEYLEASKILKERYGKRVTFALLGGFEKNTSDPDVVTEDMLASYIQAGVIQYEGFVSQIKEYLDAKTDCVVLPSYYGEGLPRILLQAISLSKSIIAADAPGTRVPVVQGENGFLCKPKDVSDLADKMEQYFKLSPQEKLKMAQNARKIAENHFDEAYVAKLHREKILQLVGNG